MTSVHRNTCLLALGLALGACGGGDDGESVAFPAHVASGDGASSAQKVAESNTASTAESNLVSAAGSNIAGKSADAQKATLAAPRVVVVGAPGPSIPAGASVVPDLAAVPWSTLPPGSRIYVRPGTYGGPVTIKATGSPAAPIRVEAADPSQPPVVTNSIDIQGSSHLSVSGLVVQSPGWGGFVIRRGSHHLTVSGNAVRRAPIGIDVTDGAGVGLVLSNNLIEDSATNGIAISVNGSAAEMNMVTGNIVRRSGHHGMEMRGSRWRIERNDVSQSGLTMPGTSGIHVYSGGASEDSGDDNIVRYNASHSNVDNGASDGNGIQVDIWCDRNIVAFNVAWNNDGAGINIFEAAGNAVYANTVAGNGIDSGGTHGALGDITVGGRADVNRVDNNRVYDNIAVSIRANVPAIHVDGRAFGNHNVVGPNLVFNTAGGAALRWGDSRWLTTAAAIDSATGTTGNLVEMPAFVNPYAGVATGFKLSRAPSANGQPLARETDFAGVTAGAGMAYFGAFLTMR